jgi:hypothetical protein
MPKLQNQNEMILIISLGKYRNKKIPEEGIPSIQDLYFNVERAYLVCRYKIQGRPINTMSLTGCFPWAI